MLGFLKSKTTEADSQNRAKVISLLNQKGGVGKTTMAFNTAHALASRGHKVLCIDMDPQSNLSLLFGIENSSKNIFHLLVNSVRELKAIHQPVFLADVLKSAQTTKGSIDILPAGQELSGFELTVSSISSPRQLILGRFLEKSELLARYDYVVIDGPPTLGLLVVNILCASTGVLVPFQPDQFSRKGLGHFHEVIEDIEDMGITAAPKILGYIPNLVDNRRKQVSSDFDQISDDLGGQAKVFEPFNNRVQLVKSSAEKKSVFDFQTKEFKELQRQFNVMAESIEGQFN